MKNGTQKAIIISLAVLAVPFFSYAIATQDLKQIEMIATMDATVSKDIVFERLPIYDDVQYFSDIERGNLCYIYRESSISCVKL